MEELPQNQEKPKKTFWTGVTWPIGIGGIGFIIGTILSIAVFDGEGSMGFYGMFVGFGVGFVIKKIVK